jgi:hypothetical protein
VPFIQDIAALQEAMASAESRIRATCQNEFDAALLEHKSKVDQEKHAFISQYQQERKLEQQSHRSQLENQAARLNRVGQQRAQIEIEAAKAEFDKQLQEVQTQLEAQKKISASGSIDQTAILRGMRSLRPACLFGFACLHAGFSKCFCFCVSVCLCMRLVVFRQRAARIAHSHSCAGNHFVGAAHGTR